MPLKITPTGKSNPPGPALRTQVHFRSPHPSKTWRIVELSPRSETMEEELPYLPGTSSMFLRHFGGIRPYFGSIMSVWPIPSGILPLKTLSMSHLQNPRTSFTDSVLDKLLMLLGLRKEKPRRHRKPKKISSEIPYWLNLIWFSFFASIPKRRTIRLLETAWCFPRRSLTSLLTASSDAGWWCRRWRRLWNCDLCSSRSRFNLTYFLLQPGKQWEIK